MKAQLAQLFFAARSTFFPNLIYSIKIRRKLTENIKLLLNGDCCFLTDIMVMLCDRFRF